MDKTKMTYAIYFKEVEKESRLIELNKIK